MPEDNDVTGCGILRAKDRGGRIAGPTDGVFVLLYFQQTCNSPKNLAFSYLKFKIYVVKFFVPCFSVTFLFV